MNKQAIKRHMKYRIPQFKLALIKENECKPATVFSPSDMEQFMEPLKHYTEEYFIAFHLDCRHHVIGYHEVSHGTLTSSLVHPREVFKAALLSNAHCLIVAHNHPTGLLTPSDDDLETTRILVKAGRMMGVDVMDHVIVSDKGLRSIREFHPELFN